MLTQSIEVEIGPWANITAFTINYNRYNAE